MDRQPVDIIDLNIGENYLEDWEVYYGIREIIANALDEHTTENIEEDIDIVERNENEHIIRDFGSGLKKENFIMMGSSKTKNYNVIGKFGIGLKDAIAVLINNNIKVKIITANNEFGFKMKEKSQSIKNKTLHVLVYKSNKNKFKGTKFVLENCNRIHVERAKDEFIRYKNYEEMLYDFIKINGNLLSKEELNEHQRNILEESIDILKEVRLLQSEYILLDNVKISKLPIGGTTHEEYRIVIPINCLIDIETCAVKIINVYASLWNNPTDLRI